MLLENRPKSSLRDKLNQIKDKGEGILSIYLTLGFPSKEETGELIDLLFRSGADIVEIGIPFSDPSADGSTIQFTSQKALENGIRVKDTWSILRNTKNRKNTVLMTYGNIPFHYGYQNFASDALESGAEGIILPDIPPELFPAELKSLQPIFLLTPLTGEKRLHMVAERSYGFNYIVSQLNVTGVQSNADKRVKNVISQVKKITPKTPNLIGFGVSNEQDAKNSMKIGADGIIIGSAFLKLLIDSKFSEIEDYISGIKSAIS